MLVVYCQYADILMKRQKSKNPKKYIAYVMMLPPGTRASLRSLSKEHEVEYEALLLWDSRIRRNGKYDTIATVVEFDFSKPWKIAGGLMPYQDNLVAVTCGSDDHISRFIDVIPHVPYLRTPSTESLRWATDKYEMRKRFRLFDAKNTPRFTWIKENTKVERARVVEKVGFPMIVKPANLGSSLLVSICYHEEELEKTLKTMFRKIKGLYQSGNRTETPKIIAEEYMEGDMYSVDSYVNSRGKVYHCPLVKIVTGRNIGHDDFYNYKQMTPTVLKKSTIERAQNTAETAIHALGLRSVTAHTELMKIDDEWKIIEVGPRMGGFRSVLQELSCDIDHPANDALIRMPKKPIVPKKCKGYATAIKWFAEKEGIITEMKGIKKIEEVESFHKIAMNKKIGDRATFSKNGGKSIFNLFLFNQDRSKLLADIRRIEQMVKVKVKSRNGGGKKKKAAAKKVVKKKK